MPAVLSPKQGQGQYRDKRTYKSAEMHIGDSIKQVSSTVSRKSWSTCRQVFTEMTATFYLIKLDSEEKNDNRKYTKPTENSA
jgi:hypothetical protein